MIGDPSGMHAGMGAIREELDDKWRVGGRSFVPIMRSAVIYLCLAYSPF
jgi:hypothetical protein